MGGDLLHGGLLEASFQEYVERDVQEFLVTLLLLLAGRSPDAGAHRQIGVLANFLALGRKVRIMERTGTIIDWQAAKLKREFHGCSC
jgi:hypothetical protein